MNDDLDRALRGTMRTAAQRAPEPEADLLRSVERRYRKRRRGRAAATVVAVAVALGGIGGATAMLRPDDEPPPVASGPPPEAGKTVSIAENWPDAMRQVPSRLPNGRPLTPVHLLDGRTLIGTSQSGFEKTDRVWAYDLEARTARTVTRVPPTKGDQGYANDFTVGGGQVVWWSEWGEGATARVEFWGAPVTGGPARKIAQLAASTGEISQMLVDSGELVIAKASGVYRVPLTGGQPRLVPGSKGYDIVYWPWIGTPAFRDESKVGDVFNATVRNVATGQTRTAKTKPFKGAWRCSLNWCLGLPANGVTYEANEQSFPVQPRSGERRWNLQGGEPGSNNFHFDRFVRVEWGPEQSPGRLTTHRFFDLKNGRILDTGLKLTKSYSSTDIRLDSRNPQLFLTIGKTTTLIDFSKIN